MKLQGVHLQLEGLLEGVKHGSTYPFILQGGDTEQLVLIMNATDKPLKHLVLRQECFIKTSGIGTKATLNSGQEMVCMLFSRTSLRLADCGKYAG